MAKVLVGNTNIDRVFEAHLENILPHIDTLDMVITSIEKMIYEISEFSEFDNLSLSRRNEHLYDLLCMIEEQSGQIIRRLKLLQQPIISEFKLYESDLKHYYIGEEYDLDAGGYPIEVFIEGEWIITYVGKDDDKYYLVDLPNFPKEGYVLARLRQKMKKTRERWIES
jgi:hypothetical protein